MNTQQHDDSAPRLVGIARVRCLPRQDFKGFWTPHRHWPGGVDKAVEVYSSHHDPGMVEGDHGLPASPGPGWSPDRIGRQTLLQVMGEQFLQSRYYDLPAVPTGEELVAQGHSEDRASEIIDQAQAEQDRVRERVMADDFDPMTEASAVIEAARAQAAGMIAEVQAARDASFKEINEARTKAGLDPIEVPPVAPVPAAAAPVPVSNQAITERPTARPRKGPATSEAIKRTIIPPAPPTKPQS